MQDAAIVVVAELHAFEAHIRIADAEGTGVTGVRDLGLGVDQAEHAFHVGQGAADLAVDETEYVQRNEQLDHVGVDGDEITQTHGAGGDAAGGQYHHPGQGAGDDQRLAGVESGQRQAVLLLRALPVRQMAVVLVGFEALVAEQLHGLVVQQAVHGAGIGARVQLVGLAHEACAPFGDHDREQHVGGDAAGSDQGEGAAVVEQQDAGDQGDLQQGRQDVEQHEAQQEADAGDAALDVARKATGAARQMKVQIELVQVLKYPQRGAAHGALGDAAKHDVTQLAEQHVDQSQAAVGQQQPQRQRQYRVLAAIQSIDDLLQQQR